MWETYHKINGQSYTVNSNEEKWKKNTEYYENQIRLSIFTLLLYI